MKTFTYWMKKFTLIFTIFFLSTTAWILAHPIEVTPDEMLVYPTYVLWHIVALMTFMPSAYMSHIIYRDNYSEGERNV